MVISLIDYGRECEGLGPEEGANAYRYLRVTIISNLAHLNSLPRASQMKAGCCDVGPSAYIM